MLYEYRQRSGWCRYVKINTADDDCRFAIPSRNEVWTVQNISWPFEQHYRLFIVMRSAVGSRECKMFGSLGNGAPDQKCRCLH